MLFSHDEYLNNLINSNQFIATDNFYEGMVDVWVVKFDESLNINFCDEKWPLPETVFVAQQQQTHAGAQQQTISSWPVPVSMR